jgi:DNA-3-methyladenine glycosylase II
MHESKVISFSSPEVQHLCQKDKRLAKVISMVGPITYYQREPTDGFDFLVHEIVEQMLSVKAGNNIYNRIKILCDGRITAESISNLSLEQISSSGTSKAKAEYIKILADAITSGKLNLESLQEKTDSEVIVELTKLRGIGTWTAKMYLLFMLNREDILPYEDGAFLQTFRWMYKTTDCSQESVKKRCKKWSPYSSVASRYLYRALDMGLTKEEFHLFK